MSEKKHRTMYKLIVKESRIEAYQFIMILIGLGIVIGAFGLGHWFFERMGK